MGRLERFFLVAGFALLLLSPAFFFGASCSAYCPGGVSILGVEITAFTGVAVSYCTNGAECTRGLGPLMAPLGLLMLGYVFVRR